MKQNKLIYSTASTCCTRLSTTTATLSQATTPASSDQPITNSGSAATTTRSPWRPGIRCSPHKPTCSSTTRSTWRAPTSGYIFCVYRFELISFFYLTFFPRRINTLLFDSFFFCCSLDSGALSFEFLGRFSFTIGINCLEKI